MSKRHAPTRRPINHNSHSLSAGISKDDVDYKLWLGAFKRSRMVEEPRKPVTLAKLKFMEKEPPK